MKPIGKVVHYYGNASVAVVELHGPLGIGDRISIEKEGHGFEQTVSSIHKDEKPVERAVEGDTIGIKVIQRVKKGSLVLLLEGD